MIKILLFIVLAFTASATAETVQISDSGLWYSHVSAGFETPKYSGVLATAPNKTIPVAFRANGENYYTYSDCVNGQYRIYAQNNTQKTIVFRSDYCDQHDNAAIRVASDGYVFIYKAARGSYRKSYIYKSLAPYDISEFEIVSSGYKAYPQAWSMGLLYTKYRDVGPTDLRELWITTTQGNELKLVEGGHYAVSFYDGEFIHMFYNWHKNDDLDNRGGIYYMRSSNGINWQNKSGQSLALPVIADSPETRITPHDGTLIYLKDMKVVNGLPMLLYSQSTSAMPGAGTQELFEIDVFGNETYITNQEHNYDGATYFGNNRQYVAVVKGRDHAYAGGNIHFYKSGVEVGGIFNGQANNYPRKVINFRGFIYGETESSQYDAGVKVNLLK